MRILKTTLIFAIIIVGFSFLCLSCKAPVKSSEEFQFPKIDWIDLAAYNQIKETCRTYWDLNNMIADAFEIKKKERIGYVIDCDGYLEGKLYHFGILVDKNGKWLNGWYTLKSP